MSVASEITRINNNIAAAYMSCDDKSATIPQAQNSANLADTIDSIPQSVTGEVPEKDMNFYDYDGKLLYSYTYAEVLALSSLPETPTHAGLTTVGWNYTLSELKTNARNEDWTNIGCFFVPVDGKTHIHIELEEAGSFQLCLTQSAPNAAVIDWGDGSPTQTLSTDSGTYNSRTRYLGTHTYPAAGEYDISISAVSGQWYGFGTANRTDYGIVTGDETYGKCIRRIYISSDANLYGAAFTYASGVKIITLPSLLKSYISGGRDAYSHCYNLLFALAASSVGNYAFEYCYCLKAVSAYNCNEIGDDAFYLCDDLKSFAPYKGIQSIGSAAFYHCRRMRRIKIPAECEVIENVGFSNALDICSTEEVDLTSFTTAESIPTLESSFTNTFGSPNNKYGNKVKFYVAGEEMKTAFSNATNWSGGADYYVVKKHPIYGVSGLTDSSPALTRTDDAVGMSYAIDSSTGAIASDFNNVFPWNEAEVVTDTAGKFLHMPDMYFRVGVNANSEITDIAVSKKPGSTGNWYKVDSFYYACYGTSLSNDMAKSVSGAARQTSKTRAEFRGYSSANGNDYFQLDLYHHTVMIFLWLIEWATKKSDDVMTGRVLGSGTMGGSTSCPTGGTDNITTPSGYELSYAQMRYHYIEDFVGNFREFVDGVNCMESLNNHYVTNNPSYFSDSNTNYTQLSYSVPSSGCISALGWDEYNPFFCMPVATVSNADNDTYFCDRWSASGSGYPVLWCRSSWYNSESIYGVTSFNTALSTYSNSLIGGRLIKA